MRSDTLNGQLTGPPQTIHQFRLILFKFVSIAQRSRNSCFCSHIKHTANPESDSIRILPINYQLNNTVRNPTHIFEDHIQLLVPNWSNLMWTRHIILVAVPRTIFIKSIVESVNIS